MCLVRAGVCRIRPCRVVLCLFREGCGIVLLVSVAWVIQAGAGDGRGYQDSG